MEGVDSSEAAVKLKGLNKQIQKQFRSAIAPTSIGIHQVVLLPDTLLPVSEFLKSTKTWPINHPDPG